MEEPRESPLRPGRFCGRYELLCPLGTGAMAEVWVARLRSQGGFERLVAIKSILARYAVDERFRRMFLDEARIAASIRHSNVAQVIDLGEEDDFPYLVVEWVEGDSLTSMRQVLRGKGENFPIPIALKIISQVCSGLHTAHELKRPDGVALDVVHRDISPANILVTRTGQVKVIDFGIAKALHRLADNTDKGSLRGKIAYMAPEQANEGEVDRRADIWSVGAVLYQLISGRHPYEAPNDMAMLLKLSEAQKPEPPLPDLPNDLRVLFDRALAPRPQDRFKTAEHMHVALETALAKRYGAVPDAVIGRFVERTVGERLADRQGHINRALAAAHERSVAQRQLFASARDILGDLASPPEPHIKAAPSDAEPPLTRAGLLRPQSTTPEPQTVPAPTAVGTPPPSAVPTLAQPTPPRGAVVLLTLVGVVVALMLIALGYGLAVLTRG